MVRGMRRAPPIDLFRRAEVHGSRVAIVDPEGAWTYQDLLARASALALALLDGRRDLSGARVVLLAQSGFGYAAAQWAVWRAGGMVVPLSPAQPPVEWTSAIADARPCAALVDSAFAAALAPVAESARLRVVSTEAAADPAGREWPAIESTRPAMMLYTSGTTSRPKGVVLTHDNLQAQVECLVDAWAWQPADRVLHVLPLNHVHGIVNVLTCALWVGAVCEMLPAFDPNVVWHRLASGEVTVFMAVPTIYRRLIAAWEAAQSSRQRLWSEGGRTLRLMVSGSAALPVGVLETWRAITGHTLLERYGMTEIGMALSNPLLGERRAGSVGTPLPGVEIRLVDERGDDVAPGAPGELLVRGRTVFAGYWERPEATASSFLDGGWFRTGDVAVVEQGRYRILGRQSVDIIKTGGEKVSALEIEDVLRQHERIVDCAVVGIPDAEWGECVSAAVMLRGDAELGLAHLREWARSRLSAAKIPRRLLVVAALPRNAMGKVAKPSVIQLFESTEAH